MTKKDDMKAKKIKIPALFRKRYDERKYRKKILGKLFVPADKKLVESLFSEVADPKTGKKAWTVEISRVTDPATAKRLARIAKDIKRQKGRVNVTSIAAAAVCVIALVLVLGVFRNAIARVAIVSAMEGAFGARCDIADIDVNIPAASFRLEGLAVANRSSPMKNLFGVGHLELRFNLLEATRGHLVSDAVEITGVTWGTDRTVSGALSPKAEKKYLRKQASAKPNPVAAKIGAEVDKLKEGVSVDAGIAAVKDGLDPSKYIERERAALVSPAVVTEIQETVPALTAKWEMKASSARKAADAALSDAKAVAAIDVKSLKTVADVTAALKTVDAAKKSLSSAGDEAKSSTADIASDAATVKALTKKAESALAADSARLKALAESVKDINIGTGGRMVSGLFNRFVVSALGSYYPLLNRGIGIAGDLQAGSSAKKEASMKKKAGPVTRVTGRNFTFGEGSLPSLLFRDIALSAENSGVSGTAEVKNATNDQVALGIPVTFDAALTHGGLSESASGALDFRPTAEKRLDSRFSATGYPIAIDAGSAPGIPSLKGTLAADGTASILQDGTLAVDATLTVRGATFGLSAFEPAFAYDMYRRALANVTNFDLAVRAVISPDRDVDVAVESDVDRVINAAVQKAVAEKIGEVRAEIRKYADSWIAEQKTAYSAEIGKFDSVSSKATSALSDIASGQKSVEAKRSELEARAKQLATGGATDAAKKASSSASSTVKKLF